MTYRCIRASFLRFWDFTFGASSSWTGDSRPARKQIPVADKPRSAVVLRYRGARNPSGIQTGAGRVGAVPGGTVTPRQNTRLGAALRGWWWRRLSEM